MAEDNQTADGQNQEQEIDIRESVARFLDGDTGDDGGEDQSGDTGDQTNQNPTYSAAEAKALSQGWKPKDQFVGDPDDFIDAKEFLRRGELFERINRDKQTINQLTKAMKELAEYNKSVRELAYNQALEDLTNQRREAMKSNDMETALNLEDKIEALRGKKGEYMKPVEIEVPEVEEEEEQQQADPEKQAIVDNWKQSNAWYDSDPDMKEIADTIGARMYSQMEATGKFIPLDQFMEQVGAKVKELMPHKFETQKPADKRPKTNRVLGGRRVGSDGDKPKYTASDLNDTQRAVMNTLLRSGAIKSEQQYIDDLVRIGGLDN